MERIKIYHQCGFRYRWNIDSFNNDHVGDGLIISPVNMLPRHINGLSNLVKSHAFFDPQFYLPGSSRPNLNEYRFFPNNIMDGFDTSGFVNYSQECADMCIGFQLECGFEYLVVPTRSFDDLPEDYLDVIRQMYTIPFLNSIRRAESPKEVLLSCIVTPRQVDPTNPYRDNLLNYLTEYSEVSGIYLIPKVNRSSKRIKDIDFIYNFMTFIDILRQNELKVVVGYSDIEGLLYSIAGVTALPLGSFENLRNFALERFDGSLEDRGYPPTARVYSFALLQLIDHRYVGSLRSLYQNNDLYDHTTYRDQMFTPGYSYYFTKAEPYKHYFISYANQISSLPDSFEGRYNHVVELINNARSRYQEISQYGIVLSENDDGSHLPLWHTAINRFYNYKTGN